VVQLPSASPGPDQLYDLWIASSANKTLLTDIGNAHNEAQLVGIIQQFGLTIPA
jgi:hypothetical protein